MLSFYDYCIANGNTALISRWDFRRNGDLTPANTSYGSHRMVWWRCEEGHIWKTAICARTAKRKRTACPVCSGFYHHSTLYKPDKSNEPPKGVQNMKKKEKSTTMQQGIRDYRSNWISGNERSALCFRCRYTRPPCILSGVSSREHGLFAGNEKGEERSSLPGKKARPRSGKSASKAPKRINRFKTPSPAWEKTIFYFIERKIL